MKENGNSLSVSDKPNPMQNKTPEERRAISQKAHATRRARLEAAEAEQRKSADRRDALWMEIQALEDRLASLQRMGTMHLVSSKLTGKSLLRHDEIVLSSLQWENACGVYFLVHQDEVVYVGQAKNIYARIPQHKDKRFDRYAYVPCHPDQLDTLESLYIHCLRPRSNGIQTDGAMHAPLPLARLLELKGVDT